MPGYCGCGGALSTRNLGWTEEYEPLLLSSDIRCCGDRDTARIIASNITPLLENPVPRDFVNRSGPLNLVRNEPAAEQLARAREVARGSLCPGLD
jgi:hypothetical protein